MSKIQYIIVQAGGKGSRMGYLTENKPKALISINGSPLIIRLMRLFPDAKFLVIADYKKAVLEKYLVSYAPADFELIDAKGKGTCAGIRECLSHIPEKAPVLISWCDLYFGSIVFPECIDVAKDNYVGLSQTFPCRWSFQDGLLHEERSDKFGVAGVFIFNDKAEIADIPESGEFCRYLQEKHVDLKPFFLEETLEIGTLEAYNRIVKMFPNTRPFNKIIFEKDKVIKQPRDQQGIDLAVHEKNWYRETERFGWTFVPRVFNYDPLVLERVNGVSVFQTPLTADQKKRTLSDVITNLKQIHASMPSRTDDHFDNDYEALIGKTKKRLDTIIQFIPERNEDILVINGKKCLNFYKHWSCLEDLVIRHFPKEYKLIHGDPTFSNILYDISTEKPCFVDPRGYYGNEIMFGDEDYDWAKLYYSLIGNYDQFNIKNFKLRMGTGANHILIESNGWEFLKDEFFKLTGRSPEKIEIYHAIIWLSLTTYAWDNYDSICGAFYYGIYLLQQVYEKKENLHFDTVNFINLA